MMDPKKSPFFHPGPTAKVGSLSILHLKRDLQVPTVLREFDDDREGYSEGKVINTRFGSFPHNTLIEKPWGSQVLASVVDTGSRGRKKAQDKRKREESSSDAAIKRQRIDDEPAPTTSISETKEAIPAQSGFIHLIPPTPENWTSSLPHRTQVVYTPDYSYILHRIRARPGTVIIEAGAGSGSFTHACARAVYSGYPNQAMGTKSFGKVWSYEFHEQRYTKLAKELQEHHLDGIVHITHRDVSENGFLLEGKSPKANAVFLDLPAPWLALPHLRRSPENSKTTRCPNYTSPLNPDATIYICTFSPCIEQVQRTVSSMRQLGWVDIETVEISNKRLEVRRERIGLGSELQRGMQNTPANVDEAVARLLQVEGVFKTFHENGESPVKPKPGNCHGREKLLEDLVEGKLYKAGRLIHRLEPDMKMHTSYLTFAILPQEWGEDDEERARQKWPIKLRGTGDEGEVIGMSRRQIRRAEQESGRLDGQGTTSKKQLKKAAREARSAAALSARECKQVTQGMVVVEHPLSAERPSSPVPPFIGSGT